MVVVVVVSACGVSMTYGLAVRKEDVEAEEHDKMSIRCEWNKQKSNEKKRTRKHEPAREQASKHSETDVLIESRYLDDAGGCEE
jgi:hypothetical protein